MLLHKRLLVLFVSNVDIFLDLEVTFDSHQVLSGLDKFDFKLSLLVKEVGVVPRTFGTVSDIFDLLS